MIDYSLIDDRSDRRVLTRDRPVTRQLSAKSAHQLLASLDSGEHRAADCAAFLRNARQQSS